MSGRQREEGGLGWGSLGASGSSGGSGSPHGAKFGKRLDFEGLGGVVGGSGGEEAGGGSSSGVPDSLSGMVTSALAPVPTAAAAAAARGPAATGVAGKRAKGAVQRCQVEGCHVDLTGAKAYYCRHKVCGMHSKAPKVIIAGLEQRFCQQCSRFHQLAEFDQGKRSCRRRLAGHNERRRKPPPGSLALRYGHLRASFHEDSGRHGAFLVDFSHPKLSEAAEAVWPTVRADDRSKGASSRCQDGLFTSQSCIATNMTQPYIHGSAGGSVFTAPKLPTGSSFAVSSSGCALSLLSSDPRSAPATTNRAPTISGNNYDGSPLAQAGPSDSYSTSAWSLHETSSSTLEIQRPVNFGQATERGDGDSSGELGLASQGTKDCIDSGYGRIHAPGNPMH